MRLKYSAMLILSAILLPEVLNSPIQEIIEDEYLENIDYPSINLMDSQTRSQRSPSKSFISKILNFPNISPNSTAHITCGFGFSARRNSRVFVFEDCLVPKILSSQSFSRLLTQFSTGFIATFKINETEFNFLESEIQTIEKNLQDVHRSFLILIHGPNIENKMYIFENSRLEDLSTSTSKTAKFLSNLSIFDFSDKIADALTNNCALCLRVLYLYSPNWYFLSLDLPNTKALKRYHCDIDCFRALLMVPGNYNFVEITNHMTNIFHMDYVKSIRDTTFHATSIKNSTDMEKFLSSNAVNMKLEGLTNLAFNQRQFRVLDFLIRAECPYPEDFIDLKESERNYPQKNRYVQKLDEYGRNISKFHDSIREGNIEEVTKFLAENKNLKFGRDERNKSALYVAFESNQLEIYAMLKGHGMVFSNLNEVANHYIQVNNLDWWEETKIRRYNQKHLTPATTPDDYIEILVKKSKFTYDSGLYNSSFIIAKISEAFVEVNKTAPDILKICSKAPELQIIFDFDFTIIDEFQPGNNAVGLSQRRYDNVIIAASQLFSNFVKEINYALGTIAHELTHYTMSLIYNNDARPYTANDLVTFEKFQNFTEQCKTSGIEDHLMYPDGSDPDEYHIELIARVPDIQLMLRHVPNDLLKVQKEFSDLFEFYETKILKDIRDMTETMEVREKVRIFNQWLELHKEISNMAVEFQLDGNCEDENDDNVDENSDLTTLSPSTTADFNETNTSGDSGIDEDTENDKTTYIPVTISTNEDGSGHVDTTLSYTDENSNSIPHSSEYYDEASGSDEDENDTRRIKRSAKRKSGVKKSQLNYHRKAMDSLSRFKKSIDDNLDANSTTTENIVENQQESQKFDVFIESLGLNLTSSYAQHVILTNIPMAIHQHILKKVEMHKELAIFMKLSSFDLDNIDKIIEDIDSFPVDVLLVIDCDDISNIDIATENLDGTTLKHVIFVSVAENFEYFEEMEAMEIINFDVNYDMVCQKGFESLWNYNFWFHKDLMKLGKILGNDKDMLKAIPIEKIYNADYVIDEEHTFPENEGFVVERGLREVDGLVWNLRAIIEEIFGIEEEEDEREEEDENDEENEDAEKMRRKGKAVKIRKFSEKSSKITHKIKKRSTNPQNSLNSTTFIISDAPSSGKTTILIEIAQKIREISPTYWISFVNVSAVNFTQFDSDILQFLVQHVIELTDIDADLYLKFFNNQKSVLIFDEFEKIDENSQQIMMEILKFCEESSIPVWIESNPRSEKNFKTNLQNPKFFKLSKFTKTDVKNFLEYFDENREKEILELFEQLGCIDNPKMLGEIGKIFEEFGNVTNWYFIYSQLVLNRHFEDSIKYFRDFGIDPTNKNPQKYFGNKLPTMNIENILGIPQKLLEIHQDLAIAEIYQNKTTELSSQDIKNLERYGIIFENAKNEIEFIHKSYTAYFATEYFIVNVFKKNVLRSVQFSKDFGSLSKHSSWKYMRKFMIDYIEMNKHELVPERISRIKKILYQ